MKLQISSIYGGNDKIIIEKLPTGGYSIKNIWWNADVRKNTVFENIVSDSFAKQLINFIDKYVMFIPVDDLFVYDDNTLHISTEFNDELEVKFRTDGKETFVSNYFDVKKCLEIKDFFLNQKG